MTLGTETIGDAWVRWRIRLMGRRGPDAARFSARAEQPAQIAELFSADQMEQHGTTLARAHRVGLQRGPDRLLAALAANEEIVLEACTVLTAAVNANRRIAPAGEWLLDNFYLIEEQIRTAKRHLPQGYSRELPRLAVGVSAGLPRVYDIALEVISHADGRMDAPGLSRFVAAYQRGHATDAGGTVGPSRSCCASR